MNTNTSLMTRTALARATLLAFVLLMPVACTEVTGVGTADETPVVTSQPAPQPGGGDGVYYSLGLAEMTAMSSVTDDGHKGPRWCPQSSAWTHPEIVYCAGRREFPPFGQVQVVDGELRLAVSNSRAAPFIWSAGPDRPAPFPEAGDFAMELTLTAEQLAPFVTGVRVGRWVPAQTQGNSNPFSTPILTIWAGSGFGVQLVLLGKGVIVAGPLAKHHYRLVYQGGEYSAFVDGQLVAGPLRSEVRPNAFWAGNPEFVLGRVDWSDIRISELTVTILEDPVVPVALEVKPESCPAEVNRKAKGVLPAAIMGAEDLLSKIDPESITLNGVAPLRYAFEDVGAPAGPFTGKTLEDCGGAPDGVVDLTLKFDNPAIAESLAAAQPGDAVTLTLAGELMDEARTPIVGEDIVVVVK